MDQAFQPARTVTDFGNGWLAGAAPPTSNLVGSFYFQGNGTVWVKSGLGWSVFSSLVGPPGIGSAGPIGPTGASGAGLSLVTTLTASSSNSLDFTGLTGNHYLLLFNNLINGTNTQALTLRFGTGVGPTYQTTSYQWTGLWTRSAVTAVSGSNDTAFSLTGTTLNNAATFGVCGSVRLHSMATSGVIHMIEATCTFPDATAVVRSEISGYYNGDTNAITGIRLLAASGTISSGTASLYLIT
jgi:hypothetical protein